MNVQRMFVLRSLEQKKNIARNRKKINLPDTIWPVVIGRMNNAREEEKKNNRENKTNNGVHYQLTGWSKMFM